MPYDKKYYEKNKEKILKQRKERYEKNKEEILERQQKYNQTENGKKTQQKYKQSEKGKESDKRYAQTEKGKKASRIKKWKQMKVNCDDWDALYEYYINCWECENCGVELIEGNYGNNKRCLDHCHITGLFRNVLCHSCNLLRGK